MNPLTVTCLLEFKIIILFVLNPPEEIYQISRSVGKFGKFLLTWKQRQIDFKFSKSPSAPEVEILSSETWKLLLIVSLNFENVREKRTMVCDHFTEVCLVFHNSLQMQEASVSRYCPMCPLAQWLFTSTFPAFLRTANRVNPIVLGTLLTISLLLIL